LALPVSLSRTTFWSADFDDGSLPEFVSVTEGWSVVKARSDVVLHGEREKNRSVRRHLGELGLGGLHL
jgi:hypothetical protein